MHPLSSLVSARARIAALAVVAGAAACSPDNTSNLTAPSAPSRSVTAMNAAPVASFTWTCTAPGLNPNQCAFDGSTSSDDVAVASWTWTWGDGKSETKTVPSTKKTYLAAGTYTVTLKVTDGSGLTSTTSQQVTVGTVTTPPPPVNQAPTASISAPANASTFTQGLAVTFTGSGNDPEQGALSGASLVWTSSIDGQIGTGASFSTSTLSLGTHTITLTAKDAQGATGTATRTVTISVPSTTNQAPTASISAPAAALSIKLGQSVTFSGAGSDPEDGVLSGASLVWTSSISGQIGTGTTVSTSTLSLGTHWITLTAKDSKGATGKATVSVTVVSAAANLPPTVTIVSPGNPSGFAQGQTVSFVANANDPEDGALSGASVVWSSSLDGQIGTGATFSTSSLTVGQHYISVVATDSKGAAAFLMITVMITPGGGYATPVANFTANCTGQAQPHQCAFDASSSTPAGAPLSSYTWGFGSGNAVVTASPTAVKTFAAAGTYTVSLDVKDSRGMVGTVSKQVVVP